LTVVRRGGQASAILAALVLGATLAHAGPTPFGTAPAESGVVLPVIGTWLAPRVAAFQRELTEALKALRGGDAAIVTLGSIAFAYGVLHAAGPGHGKAVIASYLLASRETARRGVAIALAAALVQSLAAIVLVLAAVLALRLTAVDMARATRALEMVSFGLVTALGGAMMWRAAFGRRHHAGGHDHRHDHGHGPDPTRLARRDWRALPAVLSIGIRPCSGAIILLVFAASQGLLAAGGAAVLVMGLGTGLTTAALALLAVAARDLAVRLTGPGSVAARRATRALETLGALAMLAFGSILLAGTLLAP
jgi:ABC-type nickel/cobalt efflux system permease component RcnA